jgi:hypothetical protein
VLHSIKETTSIHLHQVLFLPPASRSSAPVSDLGRACRDVELGFRPWIEREKEKGGEREKE